MFLVYPKEGGNVFLVYPKEGGNVFQVLVVLIRRISGNAHRALGKSLLVLVFSYVR